MSTCPRLLESIGVQGELIYLASPYSHTDQSVIEQRHEETCRCAGLLFERGFFIYSPIAHTHDIAKTMGLGPSFEPWADFDIEMLKRCDALAVLMLPGWEESLGVGVEVDCAKEMGHDVFEVSPEELKT